MKEKILKLRAEGKSYSEIQSILGCSKSTISYHCGQGQKEKNLKRQRKNRNKDHPFKSKLIKFSVEKSSYNKQIKSSIKQLIKAKIEKFHYNYRHGKTLMKYVKPSFTVDDIINKFGNNPRCYLTGETLDINRPSTYHFDHIIPRSRGGDNSIDNLGICTKRANMMKSDMTCDELLNMCKVVLKHHGYTIIKQGCEDSNPS